MSNAPAGIDVDDVTKWFTANVAGVQPPLTFTLIAGGHSNLTFKVDDAAGTAFVLRRPPTGLVLATAHDMAREHKIISAVHGTDVPVPATLGVSSDDSVNGAPFYVMDYVAGDVLHNEELASAVPIEQREALGDHVIEVLASLHQLDPDEVGLGDLGKKAEYIGRQLRRWSRQWEQSKTRELPVMEDIHRILSERMPEQIGATIVHGDYRIGNMITGEGVVRAVLDWELCTLGDPLADLGYLMNNWIGPGEAPAGTSGPTAAGGFVGRDHLLGRYEDLTGRDVSLVSYYRAFSHWRLAAIVEGVLNRYLNGAMGDQAGDTDMFKLQVENLAANAIDLLQS